MELQQGVVLRAETGQLLRPTDCWQRPTAKPLAILGNLRVSLAATESEVRLAQRLRYSVFMEERGRHDSRFGHDSIDCDAYDPACDHLLVTDVGQPGSSAGEIVATCRLLQSSRAATTGFYSEREFRIDTFLQAYRKRNVLELGRACVAVSHRHRRTIELLWRGIWAYVQQQRIAVLFGCASLPNEDAAYVDTALAYLNEYAAAPAEWGIKALPGYLRADLPGPETHREPREIFASLPPLLKAYLRLGARVGNQAADDHAFGTTDVFVVLGVEQIARRYAEHYSS